MPQAQFLPQYPIAALKGAAYNPRKIDVHALTNLRESLSVLGVAKPIIVSEGLIVAGHQRTKALHALGIEYVPAVILEGVGVSDEVRFNQLHNGTDFDSGDENAQVGVSNAKQFTFEEVAPELLRSNGRAKKANIRQQICNLLLKYGNWGCAVATMSGEVIHAAQYMMACQALHMPARIYRIPDNLREQAIELLGRQYGRFSYAHLERKTYIQNLAQPVRLRSEEGAKRSNVYEKLVLPAIQRGERLLDFGCGQADYLKLLRSQRIPAFGVEFFFRKGRFIDKTAVHRMIDETAADIRKNGLFDVVVVDSVINSVDSLQAEFDVLACASAFCRKGGRLYFSSRSREHIEGYDDLTRVAARSGTHIRRFEFLDEDGFSGLYRDGAWFYQKFHYQHQMEALARQFIGPQFALDNFNSGSYWAVSGTRTAQVDPAELRNAIAREFDLMWPGGQSVGRSEAMLAAYEAAISCPSTSNS